MTDLTRRAVLALPALAIRGKKRRKMAMYPDSQEVFFALIVAGGTGSGVFVYNAAGKLIDSIAGAPNIDPQTLSNKADIATYDPSTGRVGQLSAAVLNFFGGTGSLILASQPGNVSISDALLTTQQPELDLQSPATSAGLTAFSLIRMFGQSQDTTKPSQVMLSAGAGSALPVTQALLEVQGTVAAGRLDVAPAATAPPARPSGTEPWNAMTPLLNGWANVGAPAPVAQYRLIASPPASVEIIGSMLSAGSTASTIFTLPAAYRPAHTIRFPVELIVGAAPAAGTNMFGSVAATGAVGLFNIPTVAGDTVDFHALIPLDA